jgi:hypothetical protein
LSLGEGSFSGTGFLSFLSGAGLVEVEEAGVDLIFGFYCLGAEAALLGWHF